MTPCEQFPVDEFWGKRLPLDSSRWRLCTPHWRPVDRGRRLYTEDTDWGPVQVNWNWYFHGVVCRAGKARARCPQWLSTTRWCEPLRVFLWRAGQSLCTQAGDTCR